MSNAVRGKLLRPEQRLFVESLLATCTPTQVIIKQIGLKFGIKERQAKNWISATYAALAEEARPIEKAERRAQMRASLGDFYQKALLARQFNAAVTALDRLCKLDGLYAPEEVAVRAVGGMVERDPEKLRERIRTLAAKMPHLIQPSPEPPADLVASSLPSEGQSEEQVEPEGDGEDSDPTT